MHSGTGSHRLDSRPGPGRPRGARRSCRANCEARDSEPASIRGPVASADAINMTTPKWTPEKAAALEARVEAQNAQARAEREQTAARVRESVEPLRLVPADLLSRYPTEARCGADLVGAVYLSGQPPKLKLDQITVLPELRRTGIGSKLIEMVVAWARKENFEEIVGEIRQDDGQVEGRKKFFDSCGFEISDDKKLSRRL